MILRLAAAHLVAFVICLTPTVLLAQEPDRAPALAPARGEGRIALTLAAPTSLGLLWHASDRVAVHAEFDADHARSSVGNLSSTGFAPSLALRWFRRASGATRTYVAPRFGADLRFVDGEVDRLWGASLSVGAQHRPDGSALALYAEGGIGASWYRRDLPFTGDISNTSWRTRAALGVAWYPGRE